MNLFDDSYFYCEDIHLAGDKHSIMTKALVLDTNILSEIKNEQINIDSVVEADAEYYVPTTQYYEFKDGLESLDKELRNKILGVLETLEPEETSIDTSLYGETPYGAGPYGGGDSPHYNELFRRMPKDDINSKYDAIGAEVAINRGMTFVTNDADIADAVEDYRPNHIMRKDEFLEFINYSNTNANEKGT